MKKDILIVGGSSFINKVDFKKIDFDKYDILCINRPIHNAPVRYLCCHDADFRAVHNQSDVQKTLKQGLNPVLVAPKTEFIHETTGWNWRFDIISHKEKLLGFCLYTCSSAVNFAYLKGYKNVYFIGVDLEENNQPFTHWHGVTNIMPVPDTCARQCKEYMYQYKKWLNLYQCNPAVSKDWQCDYYPVDLLYNHQ